MPISGLFAVTLKKDQKSQEAKGVDDEMAMDRAAARVAVLAGGTSSEREISLASGKNAAQALRDAGFGTVEILDPAADAFIDELRSGAYDVAFPALHGGMGEDGVIQGLLEYLRIPYTGSGVTASACASDKALAKLVYRKAGIPVAEGVAVTRGEDIDIDEIAREVGDESFVKPAVNGSSYGITLVKDPSHLPNAIEHAFEYGDKVLVEQRVRGTEVTVGVFEDGNGKTRALPVVEICCAAEGAEYYDLHVKYIDPARIHRIPARLEPEAYENVQRLAVRAHEALGCSGFSRSDFIVTPSGPVILETNTIPGMTDTSLFPDEVRHTDDLTFPEVCAMLVERAASTEKA